MTGGLVNSADAKKRSIAIERGLNEFKRGTVDVLSEDILINKLAAKQSLRVKFGIDPTTADMHLGHTVSLTKLRRLQELGHECIIIVGDFTATIGDPSGKKTTRPKLTYEDVKKNMEGYVRQLSKVVDISKMQILYNSEWLSELKPLQFLDIFSRYTIQQLLQRRDFAQRMEENNPLTVAELVYPLLVGYDSVHLNADVEMGGTDQLFNFVISRDIQKMFGQEPEVVLTLPLLEGTDGKLKMSKSYQNVINLDEEPNSMYAKIMSINDELMLRYYELLSLVSVDKLGAIRSDMADNGANPMNYKMQLAREITGRYHGETGANQAEKYFQSVFRDKDMSTAELEERIVSVSGDKISIVDLLTQVDSSKSRSEYKRLIGNGAVSVNRCRVTEAAASFDARCLDGATLRFGKKDIIRIKIAVAQ